MSSKDVFYIRKRGKIVFRYQGEIYEFDSVKELDEFLRDLE